MNGELKHSLRDVNTISEPAVAPGLTQAPYLAILRDVADKRPAKSRYKAHVALKVFERWLAKRQPDGSLTFNEAALDQLHTDLANGGLRRSDGRKYGSTARQVPGVIRGLHNDAVGEHAGILRKLLHQHTYHKLQRHSNMTQLTQELLQYVENSGRRAPNRNRKTARPMTQASRRGAVEATMTLLAKLDKNGVEQVTREDIQNILDQAGNTDQHRTTSRMLHSALPVFRIGVERGTMDENVLEDVSHDTFSDQARRDFLPPEEVDKILNLETVPLKDHDRVRDRLVLLLLYDLAVRRGELARLEVTDIMIDGDRIDVRVRSEIQKGQKPETRLRVLFPSTRTLLKYYLTKIRPNYAGKALIVNMRGEAATEAAIESAVKRESASDRLNLTCYGCDRRPTPHAFRRTFATINCDPLGLSMSIHALADRLRDSVRVVDESYRLRNPLIQSLNADHYQQRSETEPAPETAQRAIEMLQGIGLPARLTKSLERWSSTLQESEPVTTDGGDETWISETEALEILSRHWITIPRTRFLRDYFRENNGLRRSGSERGRLSYSEPVLQTLISRYTPVADHTSAAERACRPIADLIAQLGAITVAGVKCIPQTELSALSRSLVAYRDKDLKPVKISKTEKRKPAKLTRFRPKKSLPKAFALS